MDKEKIKDAIKLFNSIEDEYFNGYRMNFSFRRGTPFEYMTQPKFIAALNTDVLCEDILNVKLTMDWKGKLLGVESQLMCSPEYATEMNPNQPVFRSSSYYIS